ncbi:MAG: hypothetical protein ABSE68_02755 [Minisyncoccia bacterium]
MKASSKRILSILFSAFFLMAAIIVYGSLIKPEMDAATQLQAAVASKSQIYNNQKAAVTQVEGLINQFQSATNLQQSLGLAIPIGPNTTQALNQWQAIAGASQVSMQSLNIQPGQPLSVIKGATQTLVKKLNSIPTEVTVLGGYGPLKQFLGLIETNARVTNVTGFDFKSLAGPQSALQGGNPIYSLELNVVAYYQEN